jgi:transcriptional regulator
MYLPKHFAEPRIEAMHELMRAYPLATLVTLTSNGLDANHIPLQLAADASPFGTLQGHVARANPLWKDFDKDGEVLVIFQGPECYISPSWYATKKETGKAVPTWNYAVVHAHGKLRVIDDASWKRAQIDALTTRHEAPLPHPWAVTDAPDDYIDKMIAAVVGIEIEITRLSGKWKVSQNQPAENHTGISETLRSNGKSAMADLVAARAKTADR